jgi:hypothetical protein
MKLISRYLPLLLLPTLLVLAAPVLAKGPVDKIIIEGPDLAEPIEITDLDILKRFDPWPPDVGLWLPYQVFFYLQNNRGELELRYVFYYYPDPIGGRGYIYLPGTGEPYYGVNTGTIIRGESDGRWHHAMPTWEAAIGDLLQEQSVSSTSSQKALTPIVWTVVVFGAVLLGGIIIWIRRHTLSIVSEPQSSTGSQK